MKACYFIDNEIIYQYNVPLLTFTFFMARFFNYLSCADDPVTGRHSLKT